ncbi:MAG: carbohydrate-binding family 9-like protein [Terriglobales bacterium]
MNGSAKLAAIIIVGCTFAMATDSAVVEAVRAAKDVPLKTDPASEFWSGARPVYLEKDTQGKLVPGYRSEVRVRWTRDNLYFLFVCPYEQLHLKPDPNTVQETNQLWNWDVAEVFLGSDFTDIKHYKEFEVSPQGEWIDLDIDLHKPHHEDGWTWNSGFAVASRVDPGAHIWYGAMRIPFSAIDSRPAAPGNTLRINLFRSQGPPANRHEVTWQPPMSNTFHAPERFGSLKLVTNGESE